jgi:predicted enzyme related to lactoylglutathione lyase
MSGPARAGIFIYAKHPEELAEFYGRVLGMAELHGNAGLKVLASPDLQLVIHTIPEPIAASITLTKPPARRENAAIKFFHTVPSIEQARTEASSLGGEVFAERYTGPGFIVCNAMDPEGNVFQVRENAP